MNDTTYTHYIKGGKYYVKNTTRKIQLNGVWIGATTYSDENGNEYVRSSDEFNRKFKSITQGQYMTHDRLPDSFMSDNEIGMHDKLLLKPNKYNTDEPVKKYICAFPMYNKQGNTKIVVIINTDVPTLMLEALNRDWAGTPVTPMEPIIGGAEWNSDIKLEALYKVLDKYKFETELQAVTNDRLYVWKPWMKELL